ncbi:MAG: quinolinate synthase NadA [Phycisphaerales bacterium]|nr:quinolinate synthase NadA [Phycisphaerales bacterium]NNM26000.1 quinolinate synthase NadA [Phycisphaerales bacterium]
MLWQPSLPDRYHDMSDDALAAAIIMRRKELGKDLLILGHHYQQDSVVRHADLRGDSLKLSQMAATESKRRGTKWIVFCGVHFMAETADILTGDDVAVILPDLSAGCSMADMASYDETVEAWELVHASLGDSWSGRVIPITYVNSSAAIKAFVGQNGGACCTSTNAAQIFEWALAGGTQPRGADEEIKILFLPDQHLGRNTAKRFGFVTEIDAAGDANAAETLLWDPRKDHGGVAPEDVRRAKVLLWAGHCSVHKLFRPEHVDEARTRFADAGGVTVLVHPECAQEVVDLADQNGSTEFIIRQIESAPPGSNWAVGTEVHLVNRLATDARERGVNVTMLSDCQCLCTTMYRIEPKNLLWVLDQLAEGSVVNRIQVHPEAAHLARLALDRMLARVENTPAPALVD